MNVWILHDDGTDYESASVRGVFADMFACERAVREEITTWLRDCGIEGAPDDFGELFDFYTENDGPALSWDEYPVKS